MVEKDPTSPHGGDLQVWIANLRLRITELQDIVLIEKRRSLTAENRARRYGVLVCRLVEYRNELREMKDFKTADKIRELLTHSGYDVEDGKLDL